MQPAITNSMAVKFDLYSNNGEGPDSTGLYVNGASPTTPAVDMTGSGVDLHSGDIFHVHMTYDGTNLAMTITDAATAASFSISWPVNIPTTIGANTAYAGFTGATGGYTSNQNILSWTMTSQRWRRNGSNADVQPGSRNVSGNADGHVERHHLRSNDLLHAGWQPAGNLCRRLDETIQRSR